jgi:hypothetical protein
VSLRASGTIPAEIVNPITTDIMRGWSNFLGAQLGATHHRPDSIAQAGSQIYQLRPSLYLEPASAVAVHHCGALLLAADPRVLPLGWGDMVTVVGRVRCKLCGTRWPISGVYWIVPGVLLSFFAGILGAWILLVEIQRQRARTIRALRE